MRKIPSDIIFQLIFGIASIALLLAGAITFIASFFQPFPVINSIILLGLGTIIFMGNRLYNSFTDVLHMMTKTIERIQQASSPQTHPPMVAHELIIDEDTPPEEIERIKKTFPLFASEIDKMLSQSKQGGHKFSTNLPSVISLLSLTQLDEELKKAIEEDNFERAAEIKNEINKRKTHNS